MFEDEDSGQSLKAVLIGDSGVGKTSLAGRWSTGVYKKGQPATIGANCQRKQVSLQGDQVNVSLWDTAGQEQFESLTPLYSRAAAVAILVASVDKESSFEHLGHWAHLFGQSCSSGEELPPIILAINKIDVVQDRSAMMEEMDTKYRRKFADLFFVSALTNENVDNLFMAAADAGNSFLKKRDTTSVSVSARPANQEEERCC
jgi:small GTP-binding protein